MSTGAAGGGPGAVVRQGHLRKLKTMKKKYFVLRAETADCSARLEYYESEKKFRAGAVPRRVLPLKSCYNITRRLDLKQKHVIALFTKEEQFCIVAENEQDLHGWLTAILKQHRSDDASEELLHPIQHVWQVNVQKKGLGTTKNIQGLYNLCLTDKTLTLVKIKSHNNVIIDLGIPERIEYSLKNIRRCGDSECFFYMEVGRQTATGAGELWMHSDDSNIAQSMHSTIYLAMRNCAKETENERDHIILPKGVEGSGTLPPRRQTFSDARGRAGLTNDKGLCVGSCIRQCVCSSATYSIDDSAAAIAPLTTKHAETPPAISSVTALSSDCAEKGGRVIKHHRTVSLPTGCGELRVAHERTRSAPLTGEEVARATDKPRRAWARRASTGARLAKLSPAHHNAGPLRSRCDSMPSRACSSYEVERPAQRHIEIDGLDTSRDETDALVEWHRTPRIPEEPDVCDVTRDIIRSVGRLAGSVQHSRTSSMGAEGGDDEPVDGYLRMLPGHDPLPALVSASSGSVCSGTPSTDPRFSEYQLEPATSHISECARPIRAWSVGSRAAVCAPPPADGRLRAYSVGGGGRPPTAAAPRAPASAPLLPRASAADLMELDFSPGCSPQPKVIVARTPTTAGFTEPRPRPNVDEYVDMSPRNAGLPSLGPPPPAVDGYVEMNYTRAPTRPIAIARAPLPAASPAPAPASAPPPVTAASPPRRLTPLGSQTIFPLSLDSPASPPEIDAADIFDEDVKEPMSHPLTTVREISEEGRRSPPPASCSPQYVRLMGTPRAPAVADTAPVVVAGCAPPARFSLGSPPPSPPPHTACEGLNYAALDLQPRRASQPPPARTYTQIDFLRSEKLHADAT